MGFLSKLFGSAPDFKKLVNQGAIIVDVRTREEYKTGHIRGSINIPLQVLGSNFSKIRSDKPVITCCASGMRSARAKSMLKSNGFEQVYNGGGWNKLQSLIR